MLIKSNGKVYTKRVSGRFLMAEIQVIIYIFADGFHCSSDKLHLLTCPPRGSFCQQKIPVRHLPWVRSVLAVVLAERGHCCAQCTGPQPCWESFRIKADHHKSWGSKHNRTISQGVFEAVHCLLHRGCGKKKPLFWFPLKTVHPEESFKSPHPSIHPSTQPSN